ncbi:putative phage abortive infection protein [Flavobacterium chungbukense]|uniref:Phage abortive infection protein n=1 Tax=Flavobacterium chungbukense TaxID=877464 RepID=A0ABP7XQK5_9FLAO|nr:putative phage abortive infection protein [Flavobacterium chungbukense]MCC4921136.1 putative phage abortive infection protein [Flavobacterium chungbukense]
MSDNAIKNLTISLIIFVGFTMLYFLINTTINGYWIWGKNLDFTVTGQFGDFIGGFLGTIINGAAFYFLYLTLNEQRKSSLKQSFETKIYELIHLHRENISELKYTKFYKTKIETSESRKVFRIIVQEFLECFHEVKRFTKMYPEIEIFKPNYKIELEKIRKSNNCKATVNELAYIDIAFCLFYFGVSKESETIILHKFYNRYEKEFILRLKTFLQLKPKEENTDAFTEWKKFKNYEVNQMRIIFEDVYIKNRKPTSINLNEEKTKLYLNLNSEKFYGGHQHRLGHYFRHLFQTFKYLSLQNYLSKDEKYFYAKTIRAQLSTYEQFILFFNSLSSLGMKWEYTVDLQNLPENIELEEYKFISTYNLIKNLPGSQYYDFTYRRFYPKVDYEYKDDITYSKKAF